MRWGGGGRDGGEMGTHLKVLGSECVIGDIEHLAFSLGAHIFDP